MLKIPIEKKNKRNITLCGAKTKARKFGSRQKTIDRSTIPQANRLFYIIKARIALIILT